MLRRVDDRTAGLVLRALRRRRGWCQLDLAARAHLSQSTVSRAERGWLGDLSLSTIRDLYAALEAGVQLAPRWKGAELERLLDEEHSIVVEAVARRLEALSWTVELEVTYAEFGERGSIDVLGLRAAQRAIAVFEVKTDIGSSEAIGRKLDEKARLAPTIVERRHGWTPATVGRVLVMPESMRLRRVVASHPSIERMFPIDALGVRRWLRQPVGVLAGIWFLSNITPRTLGETRGSARRRIRVLPRVSTPSRTGPSPDSGAIRGRGLSKSLPVEVRGASGRSWR
jgi:transcriptional regulator with XRE-family HTH domain